MACGVPEGEQIHPQPGMLHEFTISWTVGDPPRLYSCVRDARPIHYRLDARDCLTAVNEAWVAEAHAAPEPTLAAPSVLGRNLWQLIHDFPVRHLFTALFQRLRAGEVPEAAYIFRCDTPAQRRLHRLRITPAPEAALDFESAILAVQPRPPVSLLDSATPRSAEFLRICGWCKRVPLAGDRWVEIEEALAHLDSLDRVPVPALSHGICPRCERTLLKLLDQPAGPETGIARFGEWHSA